jgi:tagatose-1,6-bisphosphate aldolase non-catalytic subunit AgaZ/GatZ|tara:strand:+ start:270 stop:497 length:228 start_codon:yes stop_codon:yes gene_type:complete
MFYINYKCKKCCYSTGIETIDHHWCEEEIKRLLKEYKLSDKSGYYWISKRATKSYYNSQKIDKENEAFTRMFPHF